ncbi:MAG: thioesterase family protein [Planctomycetota bacterium]|jgi:predicted thioesterase
MLPSLRLGNRAEVTITVTEDMCPAFDDVVVHRVYSTWSMAHHMELAARKVLAPHLEPHEEGIGSHLSIDHVGPTPVGHRVRVEAVAVELALTRLVCDVTAYHVGPAADETGERVVGRGRQVQRVLPKSKLESLIARAAK